VRARLVENAEWGSRRIRRHLRDDPRAEVGKDVRFGVGVGVRVGPMEFQLIGPAVTNLIITAWRSGATGWASDLRAIVRFRA